MKAEDIRNALLAYPGGSGEVCVGDILVASVTEVVYNNLQSTHFYRLTDQARQILRDAGMIPWRY
jgi:hypothetical protein